MEGLCKGEVQVVKLHKGGVLQVAAEDGVADVDDNGPGRFGVL